MRVLITGDEGFIGKNLKLRVSELSGMESIGFNRSDSLESLGYKVKNADAIIHLAGVNRPLENSAFDNDNVYLTEHICSQIRQGGRSIPLIVASSTQAENDTSYGTSKLAAEAAANALGEETGNPVYIFRLPNVFGKWCRPNYNSVVATFCHNIANGLPISINDPAHELSLVYIDDVIVNFLKVLEKEARGTQWCTISPQYVCTVGELATGIKSFNDCRDSLDIGKVGVGLTRALYATYVSYLPRDAVVYNVPSHEDSRGRFVEMLKTADSGQFSYFTARPGVTRGGHYHHTKSEKFLVMSGSACFGFRNLITDEKYEILVSGDRPQVVDTIPGWTHDITNVGQDELIVMLWANEVYDSDNPDTIASKV